MNNGVISILKGLYFGAVLNYVSTLDGHRTRCVYVRENDGRPVVLFLNADRVARVDYECLEWHRR